MFRVFKRISTLVKMKFIDIGANLTDPMFQGIYNGSQKHQQDLDKVLDRAWKFGLDKIILTVGSLNEIDNALKIANSDDRIYITIGCHPTRCNEFKTDPDTYYIRLNEAIKNNHEKVVAIGEFGLDYDRLKFCDKDTQKEYFEKQLNLVEKFKLPMFLHCRNAHEDFMDIIEKNREKLIETISNNSGNDIKTNLRGVVHSFDGSLNEANKLIEFGFFIGINGCSLKTEQNLEVVKNIPSNTILIETDCPWCGIRSSHAGSKYIKTTFPTIKKKDKWTQDKLIDGRNEPCQIRQVLEIIAGIKNEPIEELANIFYENTINCFFQKS